MWSAQTKDSCARLWESYRCAADHCVSRSRSLSFHHSVVAPEMVTTASSIRFERDVQIRPAVHGQLNRRQRCFLEACRLNSQIIVARRQVKELIVPFGVRGCAGRLWSRDRAVTVAFVITAPCWSRTEPRKSAASACAWAKAAPVPRTVIARIILPVPSL